MSINIKLAPALQKSANNQEIIEVNGQNTLECLQDLARKVPLVRRWLFEKDGQIGHYVIVFVNGERIFNYEYSTQINKGDEIYIMLGIAGG
jgi:molybdopterin converting factor small subunit